MEHILAEQGIATMVASREEVAVPAEGRRQSGWWLPLAGALAFHAGLFGLLQAVPGSSRPPALFSPEVVEVALFAEVPDIAPPAVAKPSVQREAAPRPPPPARRQRPAMPPPDLARAAQPARPPASAPVEAASPVPSAVTATATTQTAAAPSGNRDGAAVSTAAASSGTTPAEVPAKPRYRDNPPPPYPEPARRLRLEGTVVLEALVNGGGTVNNLAVHATSGHQLLDDAALRAVRNWLFEPGKRGGAPVVTKVLVPVRFALR